MAMVLDALASYVQNMLMEMVKEEVHMLLGVPNEMEKMNVKLGDLKKFLMDADRRNITEEHVHGWVKELRGAMYDATDILDLCQLKAMKRGPSRDTGCFNPLLFCLRNPNHTHDIGHRLKKLNEKLDGINERSKTFNFINLTSYRDQRGKIESSRLPCRETTGEPELEVIGEKIREDTKNLVELLTCKENTINEHNKVMVFAIVGVGGIGKTTLAQNIFNDELIQRKFDKKIWVSVNQDYTDIDLLMRIIEAAGGNQRAGNTKVVLQQTLKETLEGCKTLLVMDDVWNHQAWENVIRTPMTKASAQAHIDGDWCSLEELGPLEKLTDLSINGLENISSVSLVRRARIFEKVHLLYLQLSCTDKHEDNGSLLKEDDNVSKRQQQIEEVFDELNPPPCLETLLIEGYFGRRLPRWLLSSAADTSVGSLRFLGMEKLPCCTELPDSLCQLPSLEVLQIKYAPVIKRVGPEFLRPHQNSAAKLALVLCPRLERIGNLMKTEELIIIACPKLKILEGLPALQKLVLEDYRMETLPVYLKHVNPRHLLEILCDVSVPTSMAAGKSGPEWDKFNHIRQVKAYGKIQGFNSKWYLHYTRDPFSLKTNISRSAILQVRRWHVQYLLLAYNRTCPLKQEWVVGSADAHKRSWTHTRDPSGGAATQRATPMGLPAAVRVAASVLASAMEEEEPMVSVRVAVPLKQHPWRKGCSRLGGALFGLLPSSRSRSFRH
ncbi:hypothetical protein QOZ80_9AG0671530 [Eleusine coracana subsp. coracana]|nr:hypothetical protein QOZ80_9AG0671530 [Eleusine coracana subsp. coracana]